MELVAYVDETRAALLARRFAGARSVPVSPGWEDGWRAFHRPVRVGPLWIGPPWEAAPAGAVAVTIDPGRAFGTGAHPTTRACLELLLAEEPGSLLDLGCGSGVLAVAAAKLGFDPVTAIDREEASVQAARANARANRVELLAEQADALVDPLPRADLVLANLELGLVEHLVRRDIRGRGILSGFLASDAPRLLGWEMLERLELDGWAAVLVERRT